MRVQLEGPRKWNLGLPSKVALKEEEKNSKGVMNFLGNVHLLIDITF
jgi:hypothetical protein